MHYYQFNIGDYIKHTAHLTLIEDITYRRLLDLYYDTEQPITQNNPVVSRKLRVPQDALETVLSEFFVLTENGYINPRADAEIAEYHEFCAKQKANGIKGGRPKKTHRLPTANPSLTQAEPKITLTTNHKPLNSSDAIPTEPPAAKSKKGKRLSPEWQPADPQWAKTKRPDLTISETLDRFRDYWVSQPGAKGVKLDWEATWRNWVRNEKAQPFKPDPVRVAVPLTEAEKAMRKAEDAEAFNRYMADLGAV
jgi:uncharacterized protein YdaU (DUF1376 family)